MTTPTAPTTIEALIAADPYCRYLGVRVVAETDADATNSAGPGSAHALAVLPDLVLAADEHHIGNHHTLGMHGGVVSGFLETAARLHIHADLGRPARTLTFTCEFLREAKVGHVTARTEIVKRGRRLAVARVIAWQDDPLRPVVTGHGSFALG